MQIGHVISTKTSTAMQQGCRLYWQYILWKLRVACELPGLVPRFIILTSVHFYVGLCYSNLNEERNEIFVINAFY